MKSVKTLLIVLMYFNIIQAKIITIIEKLELCSIQKNGPLYIGKFSVISNKNENSIVKGEGEFFRDLDSNKLKINVNITKCANKESLDYCEPFVSLKPSGVCMFLGLKKVAWEPFVNGFVPPFKCPFKKGKIIGHNITIDGNLFEYFPILDVYWKIKFIFLENDISVVEFCADLRFVLRS